MAFHGLVQVLRNSPHHCSVIYVKPHVLTSTYVPHPLLGRTDFARFVLDFLVFGNASLEWRDNLSRIPIHLRHALANDVCRGVEEGPYFYQPTLLVIHAFKHNAIFHVREPAIHQEIQGLPESLSTLQVALLNASATLFPQVLPHGDISVSDTLQDAIRQALRERQEPGHFHTAVSACTQRQEERRAGHPNQCGIAKNNFLRITESNRDDVLAAHRVPQPLSGHHSQAHAGVRCDRPSDRGVCAQRTLEALQNRLHALNDSISQAVMRLMPYSFVSAAR